MINETIRNTFATNHRAHRNVRVLISVFSRGQRIYMKHLISAFVIIFLFTSSARAQREASKAVEFGFSIGASTFLGDLGGSADIGRGFIMDFELAATRPAVGVMLRNNFNNRLAIKAQLTYTQVFGDDALTDGKEPGAGGFPRYYRNLSFRSHILELSGVFEINLLPYVVGNTRFRFTPYVTFGAGGFYFDPRTKYNGSWVRLQPLGTEGQGLPQYPAKDKYSLIGICFPVGAGIKYNLNEKWAVTVEVSHRFTNTDFIDDVSTTYVNPNYYYSSSMDPATADLAAALADRSSGEYPKRTAPGEQRGDPSDNDGYTFIPLVTFSYVMKTKGNTQYYCPKFF